MYSWQFVGVVSKFVEGKFTKLGVKNRQNFFFIRGAYPFYIFSSFFLMTYLLFGTPTEFYDQWSTLYFTTFILKFLLTFVLIWVDPGTVEKMPAIEEYIKECRIDLQRNKCPHCATVVVFRMFHCQFCKCCTFKYEKHSYLIQKCIGAKNLPIYYIHVVVELINMLIIFWAMMITFDQRIDEDLVFFVFYLTCMFGHLGLYVKKLVVHTNTMIKGESWHERQGGYRLHYKNDKQLSMMDRMAGVQPGVINPFDKGIFMNAVDFFLPLFSCFARPSKINVKSGSGLNEPRKSSS
jgi:hypothetical protein